VLVVDLGDGAVDVPTQGLVLPVARSVLGEGLFRVFSERCIADEQAVLLARTWMVVR
jgi:hypothetical protein